MRTVTAQRAPWPGAGPVRLRQELGNLVSEALRCTPPGGTVTMAARAGGGSVVLEVADSGSGIASGDLPHVFDWFWRAGKSRAGALAAAVSACPSSATWSPPMAAPSRPSAAPAPAVSALWACSFSRRSRGPLRRLLKTALSAVVVNVQAGDGTGGLFQQGGRGRRRRSAAGRKGVPHRSCARPDSPRACAAAMAAAQYRCCTTPPSVAPGPAPGRRPRRGWCPPRCCWSGSRRVRALRRSRHEGGRMARWGRLSKASHRRRRAPPGRGSRRCPHELIRWTSRHGERIVACLTGLEHEYVTVTDDGILRFAPVVCARARGVSSLPAPASSAAASGAGRTWGVCRASRRGEH